MALKGNLKDFTISQLLNVINLARKTGTLFIDGPGEQVTVSFREGKLAYAQAANEDNSLVYVLYRAKKLSAAQQRVLKARAGHMSDKELGLLLINANYLSQQDVIASLQAYFVEIVNKLFTWAEGLFRFEANTLPPDDKIMLRINLENIIIDGSRQLKEWEQLTDEIPSLDMALKFSERPGVNIRNIKLSPEEWRVVSYINPKNTIRQIAKANRLSDMGVRRIVYGLLQAGLVEIIRPLETPPQPARQIASPVPTTKEEKQKQRSLIHRIIDRIRSI